MNEGKEKVSLEELLEEIKKEDESLVLSPDEALSILNSVTLDPLDLNITTLSIIANSQPNEKGYSFDEVRDLVEGLTRNKSSLKPIRPEF